MRFAASDIQSIYQTIEERYAPANVFRTPRLVKYLYWIGGLTSALSLIFLLLAARLKSSWLGFAGMVLLLVPQLTGTALFCVPIIIEIRQWMRRRRSGTHFQNLLRDYAKGAEKDLEVAEMLSQLNESALDFALKTLRSEADGIKRRVTLIIGALDKIGAFPLLASIAYTVHGLWQWVAASSFRFAYGCAVVLYLTLVGTGYFAFATSNRLASLAEVVDLALLLKREKPGERPA